MKKKKFRRNYSTYNFFRVKYLLKTTLAILTMLGLLYTAWRELPFTHTPFTTARVSSNEKIDIFSTYSGDLELELTSAILKAEKSVLVMIFAMTNERVLEALKHKSQQGVDVKVICDAKSCPYISKRLGPQVQILKRMDKGLMHLKVLVIDEINCWIGSANFTGESLNMHGNLVIEITDKDLAQTIAEKAETLNEYDRSGYIKQRSFDIGGQIVELSFLPDDKKASIRIKDLMRAAQKTIRVAMFTWTRQDFAKELISAKQRGIDVQVVLDRNSAKSSSHSIEVAELLKSSGIPVYYSVGAPLLHHKMMIIDDTTLEIGSANWTRAAFNTNDDCFLIINNLTDDQQRKLNDVWKDILSASAQ
jgi:phosphatidylserine/phosphatidylglycerophosphate/cardiolipin synthase-like enzyme